MIKYLLMVVTAFTLLSAEGDDMDAFNALMLKIGIVSIQDDLEGVKKSDENQDYKIEVLEAKLEKVLKVVMELQQNGSVENDSYIPKASLISNIEGNSFKDSKEYKELLHELSELKKLKIEVAKTSIVSKKTEPELKKDFRIYRVASSNVVVRKNPLSDAEIIQTLKKNSNIKIESCNQFGWCKLYNEEGYIAQFLIREE